MNTRLLPNEYALQAYEALVAIATHTGGWGRDNAEARVQAAVAALEAVSNKATRDVLLYASEQRVRDGAMPADEDWMVVVMSNVQDALNTGVLTVPAAS